ncbi:uncharacterized protein BX663DRAFT_530827 [Cokeromyces recurvatus]|uniref:uncharacterized protein n=1 Tax=Cokeromyces recurvatus TaxID=90255 RepID=UPI00221EFE7A|nr:uncharacterized protein BX663DRAFT_530827 [Cokeromyces recurvatus]KAI7903714.1 hypothetical protein BX663DRAFT_530827 [Cokeromyces recurvatus]
MSHFKPKVPLQPDSFSILLPGITPEAAQLSEKLLMRNNKEFHIFFNDKKFHNHLIHHLLAAYSLGATKETLQKIFDTHAKDQRPLPPSVGEITHHNYKNYLGKAECYTSFFNLFMSEIEAHGSLETVRRWVMSGDMLSRTVGGAYHPFIHIGYGLEFDVPAVLAEGLAMAACTEANFKSLIPQQPEPSATLIPVVAETAVSSARGFMSHIVDQLSNQFSSRLGFVESKNISMMMDDTLKESIPGFLKDNDLFIIFSKIHKDPGFDDILTSQDESQIKKLQANKDAMDRIKAHLDEWHVDEGHVQTKLKELYAVAVLALGATGIRQDHPDVLRLDFFLMHALTSSEFLHQFVYRLAPYESVALLRAHAAVTMFYYVTRGRPAFNIQGLLDYRSTVKANNNNNNDWLNVFDRALGCMEPHVIKVVRACAVAQIIYGPQQDPNLNTAWLHVAQMAVDKDGHWDFNCLGFDDTWTDTKKKRNV